MRRLYLTHTKYIAHGYLLDGTSIMRLPRLVAKQPRSSRRWCCLRPIANSDAMGVPTTARLHNVVLELVRRGLPAIPCYVHARRDAWYTAPFQ